MQLKKAFYTFLIIVLTIFIVQNFALVTVGFLFWEITLPRSAILGITVVIGVIIGLGLGEWFSHKKQR